MSTESEKKKSAPYLPFATFMNALDNVAAHSVPNIIDRSSFPSFSGAAVAATLSAFKFFELIDESGKPQRELHGLAMNKDEREQNIRALLEKYYASIIALDLSRATPSQFDEAFSTTAFAVSGDTRVKAKTFFIKAAQYAKIPISKLLLNKSRSSAPRKPKKPKSVGTNMSKNESDGHVEELGAPVDSKTMKTVTLSNGGTLTFMANIDLLSLKGLDREFVFRIIDLLDAYESGTVNEASVASSV